VFIRNTSRVSGSTTCRLNIDGCIEDLVRSPNRCSIA
jgi:hypothetical protein